MDGLNSSTKQSSTFDFDRAWHAVQTRDFRADGTFVYAVTTTGIYCRPTCPSRRPRYGHVVFFKGSTEAERNGFRACQRCHPASLYGTSEHTVSRVMALLEAHMHEPLRLQDLADQVALSPGHLQRMFVRVVGVSPGEYQNSLRLAHFASGVRKGQSIAAATYEAGFGSTRGLYETARRGLAMTPATYGKGGAGVTVRFAITPTSLGQLLVAATARGVCYVALADSDEVLGAALAKEFPRAQLKPDRVAIEPWLQAIVEQIESGTIAAVPLDVRGTAFQFRVWNALRAIPVGHRHSYKSVAIAIGAPTTARAVARACATNNVALIVPCHRVVREEGGLGGYRWGIERKRCLLVSEQQQVATKHAAMNDRPTAICV